MRIYSYAAGAGSDAEMQLQPQPLTLSDLLNLPDGAARKQRLLDAVVAETARFAQTGSLEIDRVKDSQSLLFGE